MNTIISYHQTRFGELWELSLQDMVRTAMKEALNDAGVEKEQLDAIFFGNMMGGLLENSLHMGAVIAEELGLHIPVYRYEAACASGGMAQPGWQPGHLQPRGNRQALQYASWRERQGGHDRGSGRRKLRSAAHCHGSL